MSTPKKLTKEQYNICFLKGTEPPFSGKYYKHKGKGTYICVNCGKPLFASSTKFDSGTGWPSFYDVTKSGNVKTEVDTSMGMPRTGVMCANCNAHLGHVFQDGPKTLPNGRRATGLRYCINSLALDFKPSPKNN